MTNHPHSGFSVWDILGEFIPIEIPLPLVLVVLAILIIWWMLRDEPQKEAAR